MARWFVSIVSIDLLIAVTRARERGYRGERSQRSQPFSLLHRETVETVASGAWLPSRVKASVFE
jgi:hypothetical protein